MISYSEAFVKPDSHTLRRVPPGTNIGTIAPSILNDVSDQNLRRKLVTVKIPVTGAHRLELDYNASVSGNAVMIVGANSSVNSSVQLAPVSEVAHATIAQNIAGAQGALLTFPDSYDDIRELRLSVHLRVNSFFEVGFVGLCELVRLPRDPKAVDVEFRTLGPQLEAPGLQLAHSQLGRYRFYTLRYEKLLKADLTALVDAFAGIGVDEHRVLYDDNDPLGAAYGRFGQLAWKSRNFDSFFEANLTFEELIAP